MTSPIMYTSHDADAIQGSQLTGNIQNMLKQILVPALVTGFGGKPGAGWSLVHEHDNGFTIGNARGDFYVNFVSNMPAQAPLPVMHGSMIHIYTATSFTGADGPYMQGANLCSGLFREGQPAPANHARHSLPSRHLENASQRQTLRWSIVAAGNTFCYSSSSYYSSSSSSYSSSLFAGDGNLYNPSIISPFCIGGNDIAFNSSSYSYGLGRGYSTPLHPETGLAAVGTELQAYPDYRLSIRAGGVAHTGFSRLQLVCPQLHMPGTDRVQGTLKGFVSDPFLSEYASWEGYLTALGLPAVFENRNMPVIAPDGFKYCYVRHSSCGGSYMTDNPAFW